MSGRRGYHRWAFSFGCVYTSLFEIVRKGNPRMSVSPVRVNRVSKPTCSVNHCIVFSVVALTFYIIRMHAINSAPPPSFGRMTQASAVTQTGSLCRTLARQAGDLWLTAEQISNPNMSVHGWQVRCADSNGKHFAQVDWDADSGRLFMITVPPVAPTVSGRNHITKATATRAARDWMIRMGVESYATDWQFAGAVNDTELGLNEIWAVMFRSNHFIARIWLSADACKLRRLVIYPIHGWKGNLP